ncbi:hypothetical protein VNO77_03354 [Canavalia gladiata]|uniref:Uncharacterized protein n=1 Tax=Canavalia gladiata TaxID=3824 RepID=A0AAN9MUQ8_CANGL
MFSFECAWFGKNRKLLSDIMLAKGSVVSKKEGLIPLITAYECELHIDSITMNSITSLATMDIEILVADAGKRRTHMEVPKSKDQDEISRY